MEAENNDAMMQGPDLEPGLEQGEPSSDKEGSQGGGQGPDSLLRLAERQLLEGVYQATCSLGSSAAFSVGGSLGRREVALAVQREAGGIEAVFVKFPGVGSALGQLIQACAPATFGKGSEEVLDPSYRKALSAPANRLFLQSDPAASDGLLASVRQALLPDSGPLTARLHALNIYQAGGFFKAHRGTPRADPTFVGSLVACLPVGHSGGGLRVEHGGRSVTYEWGKDAIAGEVLYAAFFGGCSHEVLPVTSGTRVTLAYELFASPATGVPATLALPASARTLLSTLGAALSSSAFMVNGGKLGFACQHAYPQSLFDGVDEEAVLRMLKGEDAAVLHALRGLGVPCRAVRVWQCDNIDDEYFWYEGGSTEEGFIAAKKALLVGKVLPGRFNDPGEDSYTNDMGGVGYIEETMDAKLDMSITWLGGQEAFPEWILGAKDRFYYGNYPTALEEFYCALGLVAEVPPYSDRPDVSALRWVAQEAADSTGTAGGSPLASPQHKRAKQD